MTGECPFTHLTMQLSISLLLHLFLPAISQKSQTPTVDSAHVRGSVWIVVPWWRVMVRLARGACHCEACQRAFKELRPRKIKQMAAGITPLMDCTCSPPHTPPSAPIQPVSKKPSGGLEVEECLNAGLVHAASDHKIPADFWATLHISLTHFKNRHAQFMGLSVPLLFSTKHLADNKQQTTARRAKQIGDNVEIIWDKSKLLNQARRSVVGCCLGMRGNL